MAVVSTYVVLCHVTGWDHQAELREYKEVVLNLPNTL